MRAVPLLAAAALALTACAAPPAEKSAGGTVSGQVSGTGERATARAGQSWWQRLTQASREPEEKPWVYGDVRPGKGLLSGEEDGYVLYRQGEAGSANPGKPAKVRR